MSIPHSSRYRPWSPTSKFLAAILVIALAIIGVLAILSLATSGGWDSVVGQDLQPNKIPHVIIAVVAQGFPHSITIF